MSLKALTPNYFCTDRIGNHFSRESETHQKFVANRVGFVRTPEAYMCRDRRRILQTLWLEHLHLQNKNVGTSQKISLHQEREMCSRGRQNWEYIFMSPLARRAQSFFMSRMTFGWPREVIRFGLQSYGWRTECFHSCTQLLEKMSTRAQSQPRMCTIGEICHTTQSENARHLCSGFQVHITSFLAGFKK